MPCWVAPSIAAELWGVPVEHVNEQVRNGSIECRQEEGFTFIDVAPEPRSPQPAEAERNNHPPTFVSISECPAVEPVTADQVSRCRSRADVARTRLKRSSVI